MKLIVRAVLAFVCGFALCTAMLFVPAGTVQYPGAWLFLALLFVPMLILGAVLYVKSPELLRQRLDGREKQAAQKGVMKWTALIFLAAFVLSALDFRFGWTKVPGWVKGIAAVVQLASYALYGEVMRENVWVSRAIKVQQGQKLVDTGLYGVVRHPMYMAATLLFGSMPLVLGSWIGFGVMCLFPLAMACRIKDEEKLLAEELEGYADYRRRVRWKMIPFVW